MSSTDNGEEVAELTTIEELVREVKTEPLNDNDAELIKSKDAEIAKSEENQNNKEVKVEEPWSDIDEMQSDKSADDDEDYTPNTKKKRRTRINIREIARRRQQKASISQDGVTAEQESNTMFEDNPGQSKMDAGTSAEDVYVNEDSLNDNDSNVSEQQRVKRTNIREIARNQQKQQKKQYTLRINMNDPESSIMYEDKSEPSESQGKRVYSRARKRQRPTMGIVDTNDPMNDKDDSLEYPLLEPMVVGDFPVKCPLLDCDLYICKFNWTDHLKKEHGVWISNKYAQDSKRYYIFKKSSSIEDGENDHLFGTELKLNLKCNECKEFDISTYDEFAYHRKTVHDDAQFNPFEKIFMNPIVFKTWKNVEEKRTSSQFVETVKTENTTYISSFNCKGGEDSSIGCPAYIEVKYLNCGKLLAKGCFNHYGHTVQRKRLKLGISHQEKIGKLIKDNFTNEQIINVMRVNCDPEKDILYYIADDDIESIRNNIIKLQIDSSNAFDLIDHVLRISQQQEENGIRHYRKASDNRGTGFTIVIITPIQLEALRQYGKKAICLDIMDNYTNYSFQLATVFVYNLVHKPIPVAILVTDGKKTEKYTCLFKAIQKLIPNFYTELLIYPKDDHLWLQYTKVFPTESTKRALCRWSLYKELKSMTIMALESKSLTYLPKLRAILSEPRVEMAYFKLRDFLKFLGTGSIENPELYIEFIVRFFRETADFMEMPDGYYFTSMANEEWSLLIKKQLKTRMFKFSLYDWIYSLYVAHNEMITANYSRDAVNTSKIKMILVEYMDYEDRDNGNPNGAKKSVELLRCLSNAGAEGIIFKANQNKPTVHTLICGPVRTRPLQKVVVVTPTLPKASTSTAEKPTQRDLDHWEAMKHPLDGIRKDEEEGIWYIPSESGVDIELVDNETCNCDRVKYTHCEINGCNTCIYRYVCTCPEASKGCIHIHLIAMVERKNKIKPENDDDNSEHADDISNQPVGTVQCNSKPTDSASPQNSAIKEPVTTGTEDLEKYATKKKRITKYDMNVITNMTSYLREPKPRGAVNNESMLSVGEYLKKYMMENKQLPTSSEKEDPMKLISETK